MTTRPASAVRLRPAPAYDPPYDDERHPDAWEPPEQPRLALDQEPPSPRRGPRSGPGPSRDSGPPPGTPSPAARTTAVRFVHTCLEILNGLRPVQHARALASPLEAGTVLTAITHATRRLQRVTRRGPGRVELVKLRRMRTCEPRAGVLEIAAVIGAGDRVWAAAFRLERHQGRWQCTAAAIL